MPATPASWETRVHRTVVIGQWVGIAIAIISDIFASEGTSSSFGALVAASVYVVGSTSIPETWYRNRFGTETITLLGALLLLVALTLTGGAASPYLLVSMGPPILATLYGGLRTGLMTGLLSAGLLAIVTLASNGQITHAAPAMALYLVFALLVGVIAKLIEDIHEQAAELAEEKDTATRKLERLESIHNLLLRLSEDVSAGRLNAIEVGADTLDNILETFPGSAGQLAVAGEQGLVVLAARGIPEEDGHVYRIPLETNGSKVGVVELTTPTELTDRELREADQILVPVTIAFTNLQLLQEIVSSAVAEERLRLAREMHDDIGPSLASLGLALDMAAMQQASRPEVAADLQVLRSNVTKLVENVRESVADLRSAPGPTLTARIIQPTAGFEGPPPVAIDIEERRPPRAALIGDLAAIVIEAARNAHVHSEASKIVVSGQADRSFGSISIVDDGAGFDPEIEPEGHYGLLGMRERASKIDATLQFDSKPGVGTAVTVEWGTR